MPTIFNDSSRGTRLALLIASILLSARPTLAVHHLGYSKDDKFVACLETVFEKRVFAFFSAPDWEAVACPDTREHLLAGLRGQGLLVIESEDNVLVVLPRYLPEAYILGR